MNLTTQDSAAHGGPDERLAIIFDASPVAMTITRLADGLIVAANRAFLTLFGFERTQVIGRTSTSLAVWVNVEERARVVRDLLTHRTLRNLETPFRTNAGAIRQGVVSLELITWDGQPAMLAIIQDITAQKRVELELRLLQTIAQEIGRAPDLKSALSLTLAHICAQGEWAVGEAWLPDERQGHLAPGPVWCSDIPGLAEFSAASADLRFSPGVGLPGVAWQRAAPMWEHDVTNPTQSRVLLRRDLARQAGLKTALAVPALADERLVTVLVFFSLDARPHDAHQIELVKTVAAHLGEVLRRTELFTQVQLYRDALASASDSMVITDLNTAILDVNPAFETITGYTRAEALGRTPNLLRSPHSTDAFYQALWHDISTRGFWSGEIINRRKNGELWHSFQSISTVHDGQGRPVGYIGIGRDITQIKQHEREMAAIVQLSAALRTAHSRRAMIEIIIEQAMTLFGAHSASISIHDPENDALVVELARGAWAEVTGLSLARGVGISWHVLASGQPYISDDVRRDARLARPDLVTEPHQVAAVPLIFEQTPVGVLSIGCHNPISASQLHVLLAIAGLAAYSLQNAIYQERLARYAARVEAIMNSAPDGIILLDADLRLVLANPAAHRALEMLAPAALAQPLHLGEERCAAQVLAQLGGRPLPELLQPPTDKPAHELSASGRTFELVASPLRAAHDATLFSTPGEGWVLIVRDVTQERLVMERIQQQEHLSAVGQLAAGIAHDFKNIIGVITLYAQLLMHVPMTERDHQRLATIQQQAKHASRLIQQILDFSRRSAMEHSPVDLLPFLRELVNLWTRTLPENIRVELSYDSREYIVNGDPTRLQQAMMNLAINARDAMPQGGLFSIRLDRLDVQPAAPPPLPEMTPGWANCPTWLRLTISDTGAGIAPEALPHIFEPFFTTKAPGSGTGLGLAQVYGIVAQHGGFVAVTSPAGQGAVFTIYLPLTATPAPPTGEFDPVPLPDASAAKKKDPTATILLVEDEATTREALREALETLGYTVLTAANGQAAFELFVTHNAQIALVLTDLVMPAMSGLDLFRVMHAMRPNVKVVAMTGYPLEGEGQPLLELGLLGWLQKPFGFESLDATLRQILA